MFFQKIKSENETESDSEEWDDNDADFISNNQRQKIKKKEIWHKLL